MKIELFGNDKGITGYAKHVKGLKEALIKQGVEITEEESVNLPCVAITLPNYWYLKSGNRNTPFLPFLVYEGTKLPNSWVKACNEDFVTAILVPSTYVKDIAIKSGVKKDIYAISHGFNPEIYNNKVSKLEKINDNNFKFLMVGGWAQGINDRKGFQYALMAFKKFFTKDDKVSLYFKINMTYNPGLDINAEMIKLGFTKEDSENLKIFFIPNEFTDKEMAQLYQSCDVLIAPSMADAFNIPVLESLAVGKPVIVTNYSGPLDFVNNTNGWLVDVEKFIPSPGIPEHLYEDTEWAVPSIEDLGKKMRLAYQNKDKGNVSETVKDFTWENSAKKLILLLEKYTKK